MALALVLASVLGCASSERDRDWVAHALEDRGLPPTSGGDDSLAALADGLDERDVVALALSRSPTYRAELARIDAARADLDEAGRLSNPQITLAAGIGPISTLATLLAPLESLWQIPLRTEAAARALESIAESLVQGGLDLARDARLAHVEAGLAEDRLRVSTTLAQSWQTLAELAAARVRVGEASPTEEASARALAAVGGDAVQAATQEVAISRARLSAVVGLPEGHGPYAIRFVGAPRPPPPIAALLELARQSRPDVRASELALTAAASRAGWERSRVVALAAQLEGHWTDPGVLSMRAGARLELPIFHANQGGVGRAEAEIMRAQALLEAARLRVAREAIEAHARAERAHTSLAVYRREVLPALEEALRMAAEGFRVGEETYLVALEASRQLGEAQLREAELVAETRRAEAELERAIGARLPGGSS
jgi:outer membrane protein, heavy metal efflux system